MRVSYRWAILLLATAFVAAGVLAPDVLESAPAYAADVEYAHVTGIVRAEDGTPLDDVDVSVYCEIPPGSDNWEWHGGSSSAADGSYDCSVRVEQATQCRVLFKDWNRDRRPLTQYAPLYLGADSVFEPETATQFGIGPGETLPGIDATLTPGGRIGGDRVFADPETRYYQGDLVVTHVKLAGAWLPVSSQLDIRAYLYEDFSYVVGGLPGGEYRLQYEGDGVYPDGMNHAHQRVYFDGEANPARATAVSVSGTETVTDIDFAPTLAEARISGRDRYQTALAASRHAFNYGASSAVIACGETFPDALSASGFAGAIRGPVLLTRHDSLPTGLSAELARLGVETVYVVGGSDAVSDTVFRTLDALPGIDAVRLAGKDRFETAAVLARKARDVGSTPLTTEAVLVDGRDFGDALCVSAPAYSMAMPILLTESGELPDATHDAIADLEITRVTVVGGPAAVGDEVLGDVAGLLGDASRVQRVFGADRYRTAFAFADYAIKKGWGADYLVGLVTETDFADGISAGSAIGEGHGVVLLVSSGNNWLLEYQLDAKWRLDPYWLGDIVTVLGGTSAVSADLEADIRNALAPDSYE